MAKTTVYKTSGGDHTPFLRGILTQSLVNTGLPFEDAYDLAQEIRDDLKDIETISTDKLKARVSQQLQKKFGTKQADRYEQKMSYSDIIVHTPTQSEPFSLTLLAQSLSSYAIEYDTAMFAATKIYETLKSSGHREIDHKSLRPIIYKCLKQYCSNKVANRYLSWRRFENSGMPLILVVGGITGSGKSTISTELAYKLNIVRTQSTDMLREIIRTYLATPVAPTLQYSTFEAWKGLPSPDAGKEHELDNPLITGYLSQLMTLKPALKAAITRAVTEQEHLIIEGVHALCTELNLDEIKTQAIVVPVMVATLEKKALNNRFIRRSKEQDQRPSSRYVKHIDEIWELQSYLLDVADHGGIPIINNTKLKDSIREILELISAKILKRFPPNPKLLEGKG